VWPMASGRSTGAGSTRGTRSRNDALGRLAQLGSGAPSSDDPGGATKLANESGLRALGDRIEGRPITTLPPPGGPRRPGGPGHRRPRRRWSRRRRVLTVLSVVLVLLVGVVGAGYLYLQYEWGKVKKIACTSCTVVPPTPLAAFNVLLIGSDTRLGNSGQAAKSFGTTALSGGQHSDTIKVLHVDPKTGTARLLSIPRDTWVNVTGLPQSTGLNGPEKINASFNNTADPALGPNSLTQTIQDTFGIPISHFVVVDFLGLIHAVSSVGGINMNFHYPVRDCSEQGCYIDNSGLKVTSTGCQTLSGDQTLALARSRFFEYYDQAQGGWLGDPSSDLGRIERQNLVIEGLIKKVESTYNPLTLRAFISSVVNDISVDKALGPGLLFSLANHYHAFSPSRLVTYTLPTTPATNGGGDVEIVQEPQAQQMLTAFLGSAPNAPTTPPLDASSDPMTVPAADTGGTTSSAPGSSSSVPATTTTVPPTAIAPYDPTPC
jgi:LCP family protein required for cell wall assembly